MKIENFTTGQAHIKSEVNTMILEADVNFNNGKAAEINNGHVYRVEDDVNTTVADFSSYPGTNHRTYFGQPDLDEQIVIMTAIETFCTEVTGKTYKLMTE